MVLASLMTIVFCDYDIFIVQATGFGFYKTFQACNLGCLSLQANAKSPAFNSTY
jgi:hypothetical protein